MPDTNTKDLRAAVKHMGELEPNFALRSLLYSVWTRLGEHQDRIKTLEETFHHRHVNKQDGTDTCKECGLDLRDRIHFTQTYDSKS